ncbi:MAG TPA: 3-isopropylmalate dehydratase large subunit [bacterium]|nr:3-isopropylmalate dehydratase large subunit [bacterium]HOC90529.1 3-isopropylmalate dehydratase large subunit [bacterium]HOZ20168.1 3-isopropylmalate dehydratase large subunit [bacterium]
MGKSFAEKILGHKAGKSVVPGEIVEVKPDIAMSHDNTAAISKTFKEIGVARVDDPNRHVIVLDHCVPAANEKFAQNHKDIRAFVAEQGIPHFFDIDRGICHQVLPEEGFALPGYLMVGSDSHSTTYGAFGALATGIGRSEMAVIFATGKIWLRVPETMKIVIKGSLPKGISSKDVMLKIMGELSADGGLYKSVWFTGPAIAEMSVSSRMVLTNMAVEFGAKNGYMEPDDKTLAFLKGRARAPFTVVTSDPDADFESVHEFDVSDLEPLVACPHSVDNVKPVSAVKGTKIDQVFFGSCTNARIEDFEIVAGALKGKRVHPSCRMVVIPASRQVFLEALAKGYIQLLAEAGATIVNSGCGPCMGNHEGILAPGERVLSTSNRNFKGRFGCKDSEIYLCSPLTAAASALTGEISDYRERL